MTMQLYELSGKNDYRFSPYCWRTRLALEHKKLGYETVPLHFIDKPAIAFSGQKRVPILRDGKKVISDSWNIALYIETHHPENPSLFIGHLSQNLTNFLNGWVDQILHTSLIPIIIADIIDNVGPADECCFIESRMERLGKHPKEMPKQNTENMQNFENTAHAIIANLEKNPFLTGDQLAYADYIVFAAFVWVYAVSDFDLLRPNDVLSAWRKGCLISLMELQNWRLRMNDNLPYTFQNNVKLFYYL